VRLAHALRLVSARVPALVERTHPGTMYKPARSFIDPQSKSGSDKR
jgi:hypothetical protein